MVRSARRSSNRRLAFVSPRVLGGTCGVLAGVGGLAAGAAGHGDPVTSVRTASVRR
jgi:hypothetical protein